MSEASPAPRSSDMLAQSMLAGPLIEPSARWVRVKAGTATVADSKRTLLLREYGPGHLPTYYFPQEDVRMELLQASAPDAGASGMAYWSVNTADPNAENNAWTLTEPAPERAALRGYITFAWGKGLQWFEEEEEVFVHARDPYKRVDVLRSSRQVKVVINGETVAETRRPTLVFETLVPTRYYLPPEDVRQELLEPSDLKTRCPYKGLASYWSARIGDTLKKNVVWSYQDPIAEIPKIRGLLCFFNERMDLYVDGELQPRPLTPWSRE
jgi:uncharacterized protein (DUF427 family)